ncbi:MAG: trypsin-like peptidase domain-containing protein [Paracoccaceae bacterium]
MIRAFLVALIVGAATIVGGSCEAKVPESRAELALSFAQVVRKAAPAVVNIYAARVVAAQISPFAADPFFSQFFRGLGQVKPRVQNSLGSGVILSPEGIVVSNYHVVGEATSIRVVLADRREFGAEVLLADKNNDLAVMRLKGARGLPALAFSDSDTVEVGDLVLAIGNPFGVGQTVTSGIVSGLARSGVMPDSQAAYFIQTDAPINPGNSGGALVDMKGRLVGINTSILTRSGGSNGIGFAIPANLVRAYVEQAAAGNDRFVRPWAGMTGQTVDAAIADALGQPYPAGLAISGLHRASPLAKAGLEPGDVLLSVGGKPVNSMPELEYRLTTEGIGASTEVAFLHDGRKRTARVRLVRAPDDPPRDERTLDRRSPLRGMRVATVNPAVIDELGLPLDSAGAVVMSPGDAGRSVGLQPGDILQYVNGKRVRNSADAERLLEMRNRGWALDVMRAGERWVIRFRS